VRSLVDNELFGIDWLAPPAQLGTVNAIDLVPLA
jgi:hypothetical protein